MLVSQILKSKGDGVFTAPPSMTVAEATEILSAKRIGVLIITGPDDSVVGILSERDIVRALGERGSECMSEKVEALMTADPFTAIPSDKGEQILAKMTEGRFRHMPVVQEGKLIGIVTLGDVVKARLDELAMENASMQGMIMGH
ncbi:CBS domain-containing protein [Roseovarius nanhaiticus]|uniref:CBS domain-containing protein n=1 Tax=Roseovarius nanhaiticus TaxID=573024 RepID=A0A1N7G6Q9_9RHOB|nr:CBS domain-containing protein [Roseovarius nanhaiticus]SEK35746.1 CBS domain-containing protein [Roseovarius nanhaiticus]SIS08238.1 CBS domain-containing protein [Roseovarius nanhaiticus]